MLMVGSLAEHLMLFILILFNLEQAFFRSDNTHQLQFESKLFTWNFQPGLLNIFPANKIERNLIVQFRKTFFGDSGSENILFVALEPTLWVIIYDNGNHPILSKPFKLYQRVSFFCYGHKRFIGQQLNGRVWSMGHLRRLKLILQ